MKITVEVHSIACGMFPSGEGTLDLPDEALLSQVLEQLALKTDPDEIYPALINGTPIPPDERNGSFLRDGDHLVVFPPIEGG